MILISNYQSLLSAPYITEMTSFEGVMYATEPTIQIARLFMEEMIHYVERAPRVRSAGNWKRNADLVKSIPFPIGIDPSLIPNMSPLYNSRMLNACLARVKSIGFGERINLFGSLQASAHSSGHSIGSCNWIIRSDHEKIVYLSASSTMTTHPKPMEIPLLQNPDLLILTSMTTAPAHNPDSSLLDLCKCMSEFSWPPRYKHPQQLNYIRSPESCNPPLPPDTGPHYLSPFQVTASCSFARIPLSSDPLLMFSKIRQILISLTDFSRG